MKRRRPGNVQVLLRGQSVGAITKADVRRRARELAAIRGVEGGTFSDEDLAEAERELLQGATPQTTTEDAESVSSASRDPSEPAGSSGTQHTVPRPPEENAEPERLALQGVEEAQHEQMIAARRRRRRS